MEAADSLLLNTILDRLSHVNIRIQSFHSLKYTKPRTHNTKTVQIIPLLNQHTKQFDFNSTSIEYSLFNNDLIFLRSDLAFIY